MQTITTEYKNSKNSILSLNEHHYELFYINLVEVPLLEKTLTERASKYAYYPALYRDIWFLIDQPYDQIQFSTKVDYSNEVLSLILQSVYDHPTFHIIHDLAHDKNGSSFINALFVTEMVVLMLDSEVSRIFNPDGSNEAIALNEFINEQLEIGNCLECAAQAILKSLNELPIFFDMTTFNALPLAEKTKYSFEVFQETNFLDEISDFRELYM
ncbi:MAG: hypothetical protein KBT36_09885 [Kurthia sp.]|nr:hypothetical protein [Candidatus Kurthia equi]